MTTAKGTMPTIWRVSDELWTKVEAILNEKDPPKQTGRKRVDARLVLDTLIYRMRTGCHWNHLPRELADDSSAADSGTDAYKPPASHEYIRLNLTNVRGSLTCFLIFDHLHQPAVSQGGLGRVKRATIGTRFGSPSGSCVGRAGGTGID